MITAKRALEACNGKIKLIEIIPDHLLQSIDNAIRIAAMCKQYQCDLVIDRPAAEAITKFLEEMGYTVTPPRHIGQPGGNQVSLTVIWSSVIIPIMQ